MNPQYNGLRGWDTRVSEESTKPQNDFLKMFGASGIGKARQFFHLFTRNVVVFQI